MEVEAREEEAAGKAEVLEEQPATHAAAVPVSAPAAPAAAASASAAASPAGTPPVTLVSALAVLPLKVNIVAARPAFSRPASSHTTPAPGKPASKRAATPPRGAGFQAAKSTTRGGASGGASGGVLGGACKKAAVAASRRPSASHRGGGSGGGGGGGGGGATVLPYLCHLSPLPTVLFTAPHGLRLRKGARTGQCPRNHSRERWTSELVLKLASARGQWESKVAGQPRPPASFMIW